MLAYLFPGQGSQRLGMGESLFDEHPSLTDLADEILEYSIKELCLKDRNALLNITEYTQPAVFFCNALYWYKEKETYQPLVDYFVGHSLGEYNALLAAEVFDLKTGLQIVKKRGQLMNRINNGGMIALVGLTQKEIEQVLQEENLTQIHIANINSYQQIVLAGSKESIDKVHLIFQNKSGVQIFPLSVSGPFHSPLMAEIADEFHEFLKSQSFYRPKVPVLANLHGQPYKPFKIKEELVEQLIKPVQWLSSIHYLLQNQSIVFKELGNSQMLTRLVAKIRTNL